LRIAASRVVGATPEVVFRFLSKLENHWTLTGTWVEAISLDDSTGRVRIHGPLGLRRTATTRVVDASPDHALRGTAELSGGTCARVAWELSEDAGGTVVRLSAEVERAALPDRLLLALGGRAWVGRRFAAILDRLNEHLR
jgi:Polyketide cyclase / dehydrase and lipid transport